MKVSSRESFGVRTRDHDGSFWNIAIEFYGAFSGYIDDFCRLCKYYIGTKYRFFANAHTFYNDAS